MVVMHCHRVALSVLRQHSRAYVSRAVCRIFAGLCATLFMASCTRVVHHESVTHKTIAQPTVDVSSVGVGDTQSALPEGWQYGAFVEIFVRSYSDSNGDGVGDLKGLTQRLDYLQSLGITGIWLMPVNPSEDRDHGYSVTDYRNIEPAYGTLADFDELLQQAHARGIGIVMDYVINHSAAAHPLFLNAKSATNNTFRDWYVWQSTAPTGWSIFGHDPWHLTPTGAYLAQFSGSMPDFNLLNPKVLAFHRDNLRFWLNRGVDGFRFDAVAHLVENGPRAWMDQPENYVLMAEIQSTVNQYQNRYMVCEGTANSIGYGAQSVCGSAFAFGHNEKIVAAASGDTVATQAVGAYFYKAPPTMATFIANHDAFAGARVHDQLHGDATRHKLAAATYLLQPGVPFLYYGEEIGMSAAQGLRGDSALRGPMSWTNNTVNAGFSSVKPYRALANNVATHNVAAQLADPKSLLTFYKAMIALRRQYASIARGRYEAASAERMTLSFQRKLGNEHCIVAINYGATPATLAVSALPENGLLQAAFPVGADSIAINAKGMTHLPLPAQSVAVYLVVKR